MMWLPGWLCSGTWACAQGGQVLGHQPGGPRAPSKCVSSVSPTGHVSKPHLLLSIWEGKGPDYSYLGLSASVSVGSAFHPPVGDEELEGSSVTLGQGVSDTAVASSGSVSTACVYQGPTGHPSTRTQVEMCADVQTKVE